MEASSYNVLSLLVGVFSILVLAAAAFVCFNRKRDRQPPGPLGLPIIGHFHLLGSLPHQTLAHMSKSYGPLISLRLGSRPLLVASSPDTAKIILNTHDRVFSGRPQNLSVPNIAFNSLDIAFCSSVGPHWKLMRRLCFSELFSSKRLFDFVGVLEEEVHGLVQSILAAQGTPISIREKLHAMNNNVLARITLGTSLRELEAIGKWLPTLVELFRMIGMVNPGDYLPWLAWMDLQGLCRRSKEAALTVSSMLQEVIDTRRSDGRSTDDSPRDLLDVLLMASFNSKLNVGDTHIKAVMMDMFFAGSDSSAATTEWALAELVANPEKFMILKKELQRVVGCSQLVQQSDLPKLPYLRAVVNETLRLHPPAPLLLPRRPTEPCQILSYDVPKNTLVYVNVWAIHRDPLIWSNPLEFFPERFLNVNIDALSQQCKYLPFGAGRRACPGWKLGLLNVQTALGSLIQAFDWKTIPKPHMNKKFGLANSLQVPLILVPMPKSPNSVLIN